MPRIDPYNNYDFLVETAGIITAGFKEVSGLDATIDVVEYREGGDNATTRKLPGMTKYSNIVLKKGVTTDATFQIWQQQWISGEPTAPRMNGSIILRDRQGTEKVRWNFSNAWPTKWSGPSFNAEGKEVAIETLELAHEGITRA